MRRALVIVGLIGVSIGVVPRTQAATVVKIDCSSSPGLLIDTAGKFVVKKDVTNCASTDLVLISASDVTLDLNDKTLDGVDGSCANGVGVTGAFSNVTVTNGTIRDCNDGVDLVVATNSKVKELTIKSTAGPGIVLGSGNQAIANTIRNAGSNAISGTSGTVKRNKIITPVLAGVAIVSGLVERNVIETPGTNGVSLTGGGIANFNEISNSGAAGISSAGGGEVSDNVISDAQDNGIELVSGVAERNVIKRSLQNGILGGGGVFSDNVIKRSGDNGISVGNATVVNRNTIRNSGAHGIVFGEGNGAERNVVTGSGGAGILLDVPDGTVNHTTLIKNQTSGNNEDGIRVADPFSTATGDVSEISENRANENDQQGIDLANNTAPLGGSPTNIAKRNGLDPPCDASLCP